MKNFHLDLFEQANGCWTHFGLLSPKTFDSYFLDMMYVVFMKKFSSRRFEQAIHDVRPVHAKFSSRLLEQANGC